MKTRFRVCAICITILLFLSLLNGCGPSDQAYKYVDQYDQYTEKAKRLSGEADAVHLKSHGSIKAWNEYKSLKESISKSAVSKRANFALPYETVLVTSYTYKMRRGWNDRNAPLQFGILKQYFSPGKEARIPFINHKGSKFSCPVRNFKEFIPQSGGIGILRLVNGDEIRDLKLLLRADDLQIDHNRKSDVFDLQVLHARLIPVTKFRDKIHNRISYASKNLETGLSNELVYNGFDDAYYKESTLIQDQLEDFALYKMLGNRRLKIENEFEKQHYSGKDYTSLQKKALIGFMKNLPVYDEKSKKWVRLENSVMSRMGEDRGTPFDRDPFGVSYDLMFNKDMTSDDIKNALIPDDYRK